MSNVPKLSTFPSTYVGCPAPAVWTRPSGMFTIVPPLSSRTASASDPSRLIVPSLVSPPDPTVRITPPG
jgi:hypothetical protein